MDRKHESFHTGAEVLNILEYYGYPKPKEHVFLYKKREAPSNPVLRGGIVKFAATALPQIPGLASVFYKNAGWPKLQAVDGLADADPRYDPTVIPFRPGVEDNVAAYTDVSQFSELKSGGPAPFYSILDYHQAYKSGKTTPTEIVKALFPIILRNSEKSTAHSKAWLDTNVEIVEAAAAASTERWKQGNQIGLLDGIPIGVKDEADLKGYYKKCLGSKLDMTNPSNTTSWCVAKWEEAGAIVMGKTNMHEIGMDTSNNNPNHGSPINPYNTEYYSGGSSGGSASAVGAGLIPFALGCDGGGSIRLPSSWCGIYGLKTTHGWVSTRPYTTRATSTSVAGPMAANMVDLEVAWRVMAQPDPDEATSRQFPPPTKQEVSAPKRLGIYKTWFERADTNVKETCQQAIDYFTTKLGYEVVEITIPHIKEAQMAHALTILNEATVTMTKKEISALTPPNKILINVGRSASVSDFLAAQRIRTLVMEHLAYLFKKYPGLIIVTPTTPNAGWPIHPGDAKYGASNGNQSIRNMEYVWLANFTGLPSISMPVGYVQPVQGTGEFPIGLMGTAEWGAEDQLIEFGYEGEEWLRDGLKGGRKRPGEWVDVLELVPKMEGGIRMVA